MKDPGYLNYTCSTVYYLFTSQNNVRHEISKHSHVDYSIESPFSVGALVDNVFEITLVIQLVHEKIRVHLIGDHNRVDKQRAVVMSL